MHACLREPEADKAISKIAANRANPNLSGKG